jgi:hypothetical protein
VYQIDRQQRYTIVCDKEGCNWRVCGRKQKLTGKWKITKVVGPHTCVEHEIRRRHQQFDLHTNCQADATHMEGTTQYEGDDNHKHNKGDL